VLAIRATAVAGGLIAANPLLGARRRLPQAVAAGRNQVGRGDLHLQNLVHAAGALEESATSRPSGGISLKATRPGLS
jgi:hypothetical protein